MTDTGAARSSSGVMRDFSRPPGDEREPVDLNTVCRGAARLVLHEGCAGRSRSSSSWPSRCRPWSGTRPAPGAVLGLVLNAIDASPAGGRVTVGTSGPAGEIVGGGGGRGRGIAEGDRSQLFEPFFSTRPHGLGVGLMACRAVAEAHGGTVEAGPQPGRGAASP